MGERIMKTAIEKGIEDFYDKLKDNWRDCAIESAIKIALKDFAEKVDKWVKNELRYKQYKLREFDKGYWLAMGKFERLIKQLKKQEGIE